MQLCGCSSGTITVLERLQWHEEIVQDALRQDGAREEKRAVLSKMTLYSIEKTLNMANGRSMGRNSGR